MGQGEINPSLKKVTNLSPSNFLFLNVIGKGGVGKVWKVQALKPKMILAMKQMSKSKIVSKKMTQNVFEEKEILSNLYHPFIINMYCTFQDSDNLYMLMDYLPCSDFRYQLHRMTSFSEEQLQFLTACVVTGLGYIHSKGIVHRDIKPENLICDEKGYIRITDFGIAKKVDWDLKYEVSGTVGYMAPEVFNKRNKIYPESDYFSLGVMLYELMTGERPYKSVHSVDMVNEFNERDVKLNPETCIKYSREMCEFVNSLIEKDNEKRLGRGGAIEIKKHKWFNKFDWKHLLFKTIKSPFIFKPYQEKQMKIKLKDCKSQSNSPRNHELIKQDTIDYKNKFDNYTFLHFLNKNDFDSFNSRTRNSSLNYRTTNVGKKPIIRFTLSTFNLSPKKNQKIHKGGIDSMASCELPLINSRFKIHQNAESVIDNLSTITTSRNQKRIVKYFISSPKREGLSNDSTLSSISSPTRWKGKKPQNKTISLFAV